MVAVVVRLKVTWSSGPDRPKTSEWDGETIAKKAAPALEETRRIIFP